MQESGIFLLHTAFFWLSSLWNNAHMQTRKTELWLRTPPQTRPIRMTSINSTVPNHCWQIYQLHHVRERSTDRRVVMPANACLWLCAPNWDGARHSVVDGTWSGEVPLRMVWPSLQRLAYSPRQPTSHFVKRCQMKASATSVTQPRKWMNTACTRTWTLPLETRSENKGGQEPSHWRHSYHENSSVYNSLSRYVQQLHRTYHSVILPDMRNSFHPELKSNCCHTRSSKGMTMCWVTCMPQRLTGAVPWSKQLVPWCDFILTAVKKNVSY